MISNHHFYDTTLTIFDIVSTASVSSPPLYWWYHANCIYETSSSMYDDIISIVYDIIFTVFVTSQTLSLCHHNHSFDVITPFVCMTSHRYSYIIIYTIEGITHFMTSHHIIYVITCTALMTSLPLYLALHPLYLCHHRHSIDDLRPTVYMTSHPLYVWYLMHFTLRPIHSLRLNTILVITLHPLHSKHHTHYIWDHTQDYTNVISAISPTISETTSTVSVSSNPVYQLYHNHSLDDITHTISMTSYSVCMVSHEPFITSHHSMYNITPIIFMTSYPIYMISHILLSWQHNDYTWHLTHYIWHHSHFICVITQVTTHITVSMYCCINDITTSMVVSTLGTHMTSY